MSDHSNTQIAEWLATFIGQQLYGHGASLEAELARRVAANTADYVIANMPRAMKFANRRSMDEYTIEQVDRDGMILEFGVFRGETVNLWAQYFPKETVYGFDSFEGLREDWAGTFMPAGYFSLDGNLPQVESNVELIKGWFDQTIPGFLASHPGPIAFLHNDGDTYESAKTVLGLTAHRLIPGTIILFDDYMNYYGWEIGEFKAWQEFVQELNVKYEYMAFASEAFSCGSQVAVRILSIDNAQ